ncbi:MAG: UDP-2,3-diacylglucosamine diphosphatase [Saprospiraceae bacterium]
MQYRNLEVVVISDVHLGTYGCHAEELLYYLKSLRIKTLIINGDFIDGWSFSKSYFPESHFAVIRYILKMVSRGTRVVYITGNHDEFLRKYSDVYLGKLQIVDKYILQLDGLRYWFFHGDVFDYSTKGFNKIIAKIGGKGYDMLILFNRFVNRILLKFGREKYSLSKNIKNVVKQAVKFIHDFEAKSAESAIEHGYDYVVCGHIHQPKIKEYWTAKGKIVYMNSGDWIENLSALEYVDGEWSLFSFPNKVVKTQKKNKELVLVSELNQTLVTT